jgi:cobyrinic acid a,c-diamide synthase
VIVEAVMGLYDGQPSAADLARRFDLPVLAVIDACAMAGTFGALAYGLQHYAPGLRFAGVLANRVAGERHARMLQDALRKDSRWLGALARDERMAMPSRHLGLVTAQDLPRANERLDAAADALAATPLGQMTLDDMREWQLRLPEPPLRIAPAPLLAGKTVAVARDAAFCFLYPANLHTLRELGAQLVFFSPLAGDALPACDAVWLPGGYPELHAQALSAAARTRDSLRAHCEAGRPVWAECGGMMVLFDTLSTQDGSHAMWRLLPGTTTVQERLAGLGPQQWETAHGTLRGHTFHYSSCDTPLAPAGRTGAPAGGVAGTGEALYRHGSIAASYFHAWFASCPEATAGLFAGRSD